ncbi:MAG: glucosaminidase domain-containing protein [Armatimonadetes bacterium]|nr:glucosaminidase domain-containing protein [Armatimonadota bacterium]
MNVPPAELAGNDKKLAEFIEGQLAGSPAEGKGLGSHFVAAGRKYEVDPLALTAIARHETGYGKLGVGLRKMLGVGAYDANPNGRTKFDGAVNQIYSGAKTFSNLRRKGGSNAQAPLGQQLSAVNRAGWATDRGWHGKVAGHYNKIVKGGRA